MENGEQLTRVVTMTELGHAWKSEEWPEEFERDGLTWKKDHVTAADNGGIQCVEYTTKDQVGRRWLIVVNE